mmetsp:Transcript_47891/g.138542  ORF Transcript_47891/g.138542 Transcript_47891/m.138542 type:complete len:315 (-) Transcript_47891:560-1504(-)
MAPGRRTPVNSRGERPQGADSPRPASHVEVLVGPGDAAADALPLDPQDAPEAPPQDLGRLLEAGQQAGAEQQRGLRRPAERPERAAQEVAEDREVVEAPDPAVEEHWPQAEAPRAPGRRLHEAPVHDQVPDEGEGGVQDCGQGPERLEVLLAERELEAIGAHVAEREAYDGQRREVLEQVHSMQDAAQAVRRVARADDALLRTDEEGAGPGDEGQGGLLALLQGIAEAQVLDPLRRRRLRHEVLGITQEARLPVARGGLRPHQGVAPQLLRGSNHHTGTQGQVKEDSGQRREAISNNDLDKRHLFAPVGTETTP